MDARDVVALIRLGRAYAAIGKVDEAKQTFSQVLEIDPTNSRAPASDTCYRVGPTSRRRAPPRQCAERRFSSQMPIHHRRRATALCRQRRTYVDDMPNEAAMITVLALADMYAAAQVTGAPWTLLLDEFGGVMHIAANRALAMLQRGRSHHGQVIVVTQSAADPEALTGQPGLLASLTDNFTGFAIHRQNAPETRDWLAKLMGTTALWQSTDQTTGHGSAHSGQGSRRRVRQFRVGSDTFAELERGEAIIYSTIDGHPRRAHVLRARLPEGSPERIGAGERHPCEIAVHRASTLEQLIPASATSDDDGPAPADAQHEPGSLELFSDGAEDMP